MADFEDDPVYRDSKREIAVILIAWALCFIWSVTYGYLEGYTRHDRMPGDITFLLPPLDRFDRDPETLQTPFGLGIPDWAFWGVTVPWILCLGFSAWFSFVFMRDDPEVLDVGETGRTIEPPTAQGEEFAE